MPVLKLDRNDFTSNTKSGRMRALAQVHAVMYWPDDEKARRQYLEFGELIAWQDLLASIPAGSNIELPKEHAAKMFAAAGRVLPASEIHAREKAARDDAMRAAKIFENVLTSETPTSIGEQIDLATATTHAISTRQVERIWQRYQPSVHLSAASGAIFEGVRHSDPDFEPVRHEMTLLLLPLMIRLAEAYRIAGERLQLRQSKRTLLDPATTWRIENGPAVELEVKIPTTLDQATSLVGQYLKLSMVPARGEGTALH